MSRRERKRQLQKAAAAAAAEAARQAAKPQPEEHYFPNHDEERNSFYVRTIHVPKDMESQYKRFEYYLREAAQPKGAIEYRLFIDFLRAEWNMYRIELAQQALAEQGLDPLLSDDKEVRRLEGLYHRNRSARNSALSHLSALQSSRLADMACPDPAPGVFRPPLAKSGDIIALANRTHPMAMEVARAKAHAAMTEAYSKTGIRPTEPLRHTDFLTKEEKEDPGKDFFKK